MAAIKRSQKIFRGIDYIGNFLAEPIALCNVYRCDARSFVLLANLQDFVDISLDQHIVQGTKQNVSFTKESSVSVKAGVGGDVHAGRGELELNFQRKNSAFVSLKNVVVSQVKLGLLSDTIGELWKRKKYRTNGSVIIVNQILEAESGTVIFSQERNNRVVLRATTSESLSSVGKTASGNVEFVTNSKATLEIISPEPMLPMFKAFYLDNKGRIQVVKG
jgi:hypothetical protein